MEAMIELQRAKREINDAVNLFDEIMRWRDAPENDAFPHDTKLSIGHWLKKNRPKPKRKPFTHIGQSKSNNCGQTCVSIVTGESVSAIEDIMSKFGRTTTGDMRFAFQELGYRLEQLQTINQKRTAWFQYCKVPVLLKVSAMPKATKKWSHWCVFYDDVVFDPEYHNAMSRMSWEGRTFDLGRVTSFAPIRKV